MICNHAGEMHDRLCKALAAMKAALQISDALDAPGVIGSHLDLAVTRLEHALALCSSADDACDPRSGTPWGFISA